MTREELNELRDNSKNDDQIVEILFDKINDFESRTCENCKYSEYHSQLDILECLNESIEMKQRCYKCGENVSIFEVTKNFGCNKFERKDHE